MIIMLGHRKGKKNSDVIEVSCKHKQFFGNEMLPIFLNEIFAREGENIVVFSSSSCYGVNECTYYIKSAELPIEETCWVSNILGIAFIQYYDIPLFQIHKNKTK